MVMCLETTSPAGASPHGTLPAQLTAALTERAVLSELSRRELAHPFDRERPGGDRPLIEIL